MIIKMEKLVGGISNNVGDSGKTCWGDFHIYIYIHPSSEVVGLFWILENLGRAFFPHLETTTIATSRPQFSISTLVQKSLGQFLHPEPLGKRPGRKDLWKKWKSEFSSSGRPKSAPGVRFSESP